MQFNHDTEAALRLVAALVNSELDGDALADREGLEAFLDEHQVSGGRTGSDGERRAVQALRPTLAAAWDSEDEEGVIHLVNELFEAASALPRLTRHDGWDWHLHLTSPDAPLVDRLGTEAAMGIADLVRAKDLERLKRCDGEGCRAVFVDLSRNRSRRYCDTGNCGNRAHVAAYRARQAQEAG